MAKDLPQEKQGSNKETKLYPNVQNVVKFKRWWQLLDYSAPLAQKYSVYIAKTSPFSEPIPSFLPCQ